MCSKESAFMLIEACNAALEDAEWKLTLFIHLDELLEESSFVKYLKQITKNEYILRFLDEFSQNNIGNSYELISNFIHHMNHIKHLP